MVAVPEMLAEKSAPILAMKLPVVRAGLGFRMLLIIIVTLLIANAEGTAPSIRIDRPPAPPLSEQE